MDGEENPLAPAHPDRAGGGNDRGVLGDRVGELLGEPLMAYFSNGTEGMVFTEAWCGQCRNWRERENDPDKLNGPGCPIWDAHIMGELVNEKVRAALSMLITEDHQCRMFEPAATTLSETDELDRLLGFTPGISPAWHERMDRLRKMHVELLLRRGANS